MVILIILDGFGLNPKREANAIALAKKPNLDRLFATYPTTQLEASGPAVGLPPGQMGNSEVGHLNLGAGRIVYQEITRIDRAIADGSFFENRALVGAMERCRRNKSRLHLMGLVSDGGIHSSQEHLYALLDLARRKGAGEVYIHAFLDGRDTMPTTGAGYLKQLQEKCRSLGVGKIASVMGRWWAMDRDKRWDRTTGAYLAIVKGEGKIASDPVRAVEESYQANVTDEFVAPVVITENGDPREGRIADGDEVIFFNFRADRTRQISHLLVDQDRPVAGVNPKPEVNLTAMTHYDDTLKVPEAFPAQFVTNTFGELVSRAGLKQLRIAETEKYPHVTFFFNGGNEAPFPGEERILIPSPKVATYDLQPEMSAPEVTRKVVEKIGAGEFDVIILNYANPDMVGHTGVLPAAIKAVETVDGCLAQVLRAVEEVNDSAILTADHGNCDLMVDAKTGGPHTAHTTNPVPCAVIHSGFSGKLRAGGILADVAPTLLEMLHLQPAPEMTGKSLLH